MRRLRAAVRVLVVGHADRAVAFQRLEALAVGLGLLRLRVGGDQLLPRCLLSESVIGVVEHGDHVALAYRLADFDPALLDLAADAEGLVDLVARLHGAGIAIRFRRVFVAELDGANGTQHLGGGFVL